MTNTFHNLLGLLHRAVANSRVGAALALKVRNQATAVIRARMNDGILMSDNGELWLIRQLAPEAKVFIDVGANTGAWSLSFLQHMPHGGQGFLFEPSPLALEKLRRDLTVHLETGRVNLISAAVSDKTGFMPFYMESDAGETSSLIQEHSQSEARRIEVRVTNLDAEIARCGLDFVDVLKIDAEGFDLHVIKGASASLRQHKLGVIQFEYNYPWCLAGSTLAEAIALLESNNYRLYLLKRDGLYEFDYGKYGDFFGYSNFVAVLPTYAPQLERAVVGVL